MTISSPRPEPQLLILFDDLVIMQLQLLNALFQFQNLVLGAGREFFDDLEHTPQSADDDQRAGLLHGTAQNDIDDKGRHDHQGIEDVEFGAEVAAKFGSQYRGADCGS